MHRDHLHCPLPAPAFCSSTTPNAMRSGTTEPLPACLMRSVLMTSPPMLYHVHTHLTSTHHRYAAQLTILCALLPNMRHHSRAWGLLHPFSHDIRCFPRHPCTTTIAGTAPLFFPPTPVPLAQRLSWVLRIPCVCSTYRRPLSFPSHSSPPGTPRLSLAGFCSHLSPAVHDHRRAQRPPRPFLLVGVPLVTSTLAATSSAPSHSKPISATQQKHDAWPQHLQHRLPVTCVAFVVSPHAATFLGRRVDHMRQSLPIPSALFSASPMLRPFSPLQAPSIACTAPPISISKKRDEYVTLRSPNNRGNLVDKSPFT
ncbi:hypothetical protein DFH08DRAFT_1000708 [Mycena albidolilacea]|uniref:Uncharacterized protein n=1 Tax=Mycena albidolilacea TaxID=1033008 RepID=A0AAD7A3C8_9AGAR|nr:hypothetical protein DFH08DRAFT_1000708 [Mycena albidolilacea]